MKSGLMSKKYSAVALLVICSFCACSSMLLADFEGCVQSVFRLSGVSKNNQPVFGTCFLVQSQANVVWLVTAAHILDAIGGDQARLLLRRAVNSTYESFEASIAIREGSQNLYARHQNFDLAVLRIVLPDGIAITTFSLSSIADIDAVRRLRPGPGDLVIIPGYPYGEPCNSGGFAFTRSGVISSFPFSGALAGGMFSVDFSVIEGYSGAPIVLADKSRRIVIGMVSQEIIIEELRNSQKAVKKKQVSPGFARAINGTVIREFISSLR